MEEEYIKSLVHEQMIKEKKQILKELQEEINELKERIGKLEKEYEELKKETFAFKYETSNKIDEFMERVEEILKGGTLPLFLSTVSIALGGILLFFGILETNLFLGVLDKLSNRTFLLLGSAIISTFLGFMLLYFAYDILKKRI